MIAVFGQEAVAISRDHGETFTLQAGPDNLRQVKDAVVDEKGFIVAVGASDSSESPVAVSRDRGVTWRVAGPLPSRSGACNYATLTADRRLVVSDLDGQCPTTISEDRGVSWRPVDETWPLVGPTADLGAALLAASARGIATLVGGHGLHPLGLREPLRDQLFVDPLHAIGLGRDDGLYRSWNGGRTWHFIPATGGMRYSRLVSNGLSMIAVGDQGLMMSTDGGGSWRPGSLGQACEPEFLAMNDALAFLGCRAGPVLMTEDVGRSWRAVDSLDSVSWMGVSQDGQSFLALSEDRRTISRYRPTSDRWEMALSLASDQVMDVWSSPSGLMLTTDQGELAFLRDEREQPVWLAVDSVRRLSNIKQARPLSSGHLLILDQHGLWVWTENSSLRSVLPIQGAHSFTLTGDGGVAISGHTSTQRLSRVRP